MSKIDKRNILDDNIFSFRTNKDGKVFIYWYDKQVTILKGKRADKFLSKINKTENEKQKQLIMAKETGNFKRGNEK